MRDDVYADPERRRAALRTTLQQLGLEDGGYRALMLLPLVYVAWADGKMEGVEKARIRQIASERLHLPPASASALERWLTEQPSRSQIEAGLQGLLDVALDERVLEVDVSELPDLVLHAEAIARATAEALDDPSAVTPEEERALKDIAELLQVDGGATWKEVLEELRSRAPKPPRASSR